MKNSIAILSALLILIGTLSAQTLFKSYNYEGTKQQAQLDGKSMMIYFTAEWCKPCKKMERESFSTSEVSNLINGNFVPYKFDIDKEANGKSVADQFLIDAYPTIVFIDKSGNESGRIIGYRSKDELVRNIKSFSQKCAKRNFTSFR